MVKTKQLKVLWCMVIVLAFAFSASAFDVAIIGVKPHTTSQWTDAEKISGTLYKSLSNISSEVNVLTASQVMSVVGDRRAYLEAYQGGVPQLPKVDAVVIGEIVPQGDTFLTSLRLYNLLSRESIQFSLSGKPGDLDKTLASGLAQILATNLNTEYKVISVGSQTLDLMTAGLGVFRGQKFNVYRKEEPGDKAFAKYMKSPLVRVGEIEITAVNGRIATARITRQDPYLKIRTGDSVSKLGVVSFGTLDIDSNPRGASIFLDGYLIGRTPITIRNIPEGTYHLRFTESQSSDHTEIVKVSGDSVSRVYVTLPEKPGQLNISSNKPGELYINSVKKGTTPLTVTLPKGYYRLELVVPGYPTQEQNIWVIPGMFSPIHFNILGSPAESYFNSSPSGASVYLDGNFVGNTPLGPYYVEPGYHDIKISMSGWRDFTQRYLFNSGKREQIEAKLLLPPGTITVYSEPTRATVKVDGKVVGVTPLTYSEAGPGQITVEISKEGYRPVVKTLNIYSNEKLVLEETLERKVGTLVIKSDTRSGAKVYIDGSYEGTTPLEIDRIPEGTYKVELFSGNLASRDLVSVKDREIKEFTANLVSYALLPNVEKRLMFTIGADFKDSPLIVGVTASSPLSKDLTLRAGVDSYGGDFGGGYGEYAQYTNLQAGLDYYVNNVGVFVLGRFLIPTVGDPYTKASGGLSFRLSNPDWFVLNARVGVSYESKLDPYWEVEFNSKIGIPQFILGGKIASSPKGNIESRFNIGFTF
ncbi:MAG: PEGA domain-containing protein [Firmicutes bacterium]|nr:PEGA domain-containing protein [Bacillota bacterium]